jgi:hypothetical protein
VITTRMFAEIAALAGDPARAGMLHAMLGRAMTASEMAWVAGTAPQTASGHLARIAVTETGWESYGDGHRGWNRAGG